MNEGLAAILKMIHVFCDIMPSRWARRYEESCCLHTQDQGAALRLRTTKSSIKGRETQTVFILSELGRYEHFNCLTCFQRMNLINKNNQVQEVLNRLALKMEEKPSFETS